MVDQPLHRGAHDLGDVFRRVAQAVRAEFQIRRPGQLLVGDHHRTRLQSLQALFDDLQRLLHLADPDQVAAVAVRGGVGDDVEVVSLITAIGLGLAQIVRQPGGTQHRPGHAQCHAPGQVEVADVLSPGLEDVVLGHQLLEFVESAGQDLQQLGDPLLAVARQVGGNATGADVGAVHPQSGDRLEDAQDQVALPEPEEHHRHRAEFHPAGGQCDQMRGDAVEFHHHHPDHRGALRDVVGDTEQPFDTQAVGSLVEKRRQVVHPGHERHALRPGAVLEVLLDAGVQIADAATGFDDRLAFDLQDQPQHAVRRGVLRAHVDHDALTGEAGAGGADDLVPVLPAEVDDSLVDAHQWYDLRSSGGGICAP